MTPAQVLVLGAGSAAGEYLIRSLRRKSPALTLAGCHEDRFALRHSAADARYLVPAPRGRMRVVDGCYMVRDLDMAPGIFRGEELFDGIDDAARATPGGGEG